MSTVDGVLTGFSYNVPPYGRSGLYLELSLLKELIDEYSQQVDHDDEALVEAIYGTAVKSGIVTDVPLAGVSTEGESVPTAVVTSGKFQSWVSKVSDYLVEVQERLFSSGLR